MKMKTTFAVLGATVLLLPAAATAATFNYVDSMGMVRSIEADSSMQAIANAPNIHPRSGVAIDRGLVDVGDDVAVGGSGDASMSGSNRYHYVTVNGEVRTVTANSAMEVLNMNDIHPHSGAAVDTGMIEAGMDVPGT